MIKALSSGKAPFSMPEDPKKSPPVLPKAGILLLCLGRIGTLLIGIVVIAIIAGVIGRNQGIEVLDKQVNADPGANAANQGAQQDPQQVAGPFSEQGILFRSAKALIRLPWS